MIQCIPKLVKTNNYLTHVKIIYFSMFLLAIQTHAQFTGVSPIFLSNFLEVPCETRHAYSLPSLTCRLFWLTFWDANFDFFKLLVVYKSKEELVWWCECLVGPWLQTLFSLPTTRLWSRERRENCSRPCWFGILQVRELRLFI